LAYKGSANQENEGRGAGAGAGSVVVGAVVVDIVIGVHVERNGS
jgi:hypothetical protein